MTDIFHEVEEDVRRERYEKLWKLYGNYAIAGVFAVLFAVVGFKLWQRYEQQQRISASQTFLAAQKVADAGDGQQAAQTFADLVKTAPGGYATLAKLAEADALLSAGNRSDAVTLYKQVADKDSGTLGSVARLRAAWAMADYASKSDLQSLLTPLTDPKSKWQYPAREVLAYADYRAGNIKLAQSEFASLGKAKDAPDGVRQRANAMATFIAAGGDADFGTVPPMAKPSAPAQAGTTEGNP